MYKKHLDIHSDATRSLNAAWEFLCDEFYTDLEGRLEPTNFDNNLLGALTFCLEAGIYPPPKLLLLIAGKYEIYMASKGELSLEEVFYGRPERSTGNYSSRSHKEAGVRLLDMELTFNELQIVQSSRRSQVEVAEEHLNRQGSEQDPESLLRKLRRYRASKK
ncbi:hypothetical protein [Vibrio parahaemolyticus]|uniref:hypothetical protein n=5 Tax=Vibrio parahaemolyticus TaxID=670 RepID=UPI00111E9586|nr:hypothetical protein [Vibrio parahaemolyticus]EGQ8037713.1 hypothetical protein [Vibrio parahaemolyticus]EHD2278942.1 hypothetical protein [Vibrio parahaemolyticus]EHH2498132.1 hypothetical protein [Vibrio parahaemolyticus]EHR0874611.1 hypothetical protein [Vibrio parahaemolyticus]EID4327909.1 hypothetical protein [Vibrio parahaemolyticus]